MVHRCASRSDHSGEKQYHTHRVSCRKRQFYWGVQVELSRRRTLPTSRTRLDKTRRARRGDQVAALRALRLLEDSGVNRDVGFDLCHGERHGLLLKTVGEHMW